MPYVIIKHIDHQCPWGIWPSLTRKAVKDSTQDGKEELKQKFHSQQTWAKEGNESFKQNKACKESRKSFVKDKFHNLTKIIQAQNQIPVKKLLTIKVSQMLLIWTVTKKLITQTACSSFRKKRCQKNDLSLRNPYVNDWS